MKQLKTLQKLHQNQAVKIQVTRNRPARKSIKRGGQYCFENQMLEILSEKQQAATDEDVTYAMSLVPFLKRISEDKKLGARIEILQVLRRFANTGTQPVQLPTCHTLQNQSQGSYQTGMDPYWFSGGGVYGRTAPQMQPIPSTSTYGKYHLTGQGQPRQQRQQGSTFSTWTSLSRSVNSQVISDDSIVHTPDSDILHLDYIMLM